MPAGQLRFEYAQMKVIAGAVVFATILFGEATAGSEELQMRALEAVACSMALQSFQRENQGADLAHYTVLVKNTPDAYEIVFVPDQPGERERHQDDIAELKARRRHRLPDCSRPRRRQARWRRRQPVSAPFPARVR